MLCGPRCRALAAVFVTTEAAPIVQRVLAEIIVCPLCHASLDGVTCRSCRHVYAMSDGALNQADPQLHLSVRERRDARLFAEFADLQGLVLDVGCGVQALPSYARGLAGELVGIDPLRGERDRGFEFVQGVAEYLPFRDHSFDRVLFATSIDHVLVPELAVAEARRVCNVDGYVCVWFGEVGDASLLEKLGARVGRWAKRGATEWDVPDGAIDPFHVDHPDARTVIEWLEEAGLTVQAVERPLRGHCFVRARRSS
jgi:ubiquinone/menaquinone biosynthesis C-methylase UbiE